MITVPSTPPPTQYPKMKISPSPHSVQYPHLCSDLMNDDTTAKEVSFRTATMRFSQVSSPVKPPCHPFTPVRVPVKAVSRKCALLEVPFSDEATASVAQKQESRHVQRDVSFRTLAKRFASKNIRATTQKNPGLSNSLPSCLEKTERLLSENISIQNIPKPPMSVDTAIKEKVSANKAKEFQLPMPLYTSSKPTHQRRSSTGGPNATWTPLNSPKNDFVHTKVFQKRYNAAATTIQRVLRGFFGRYKVVQILSAIKIQTMVRQHRQRLVAHKQNASIVIQAFVRGWRCRVRTRVYQLENELRLIEQRKQRELLDVQAWKEQKMEKIRLSAQSMDKEARQQSFRYKETLAQADKLIKYLRKENKKLRDKNDALQVAINLMFEENKILEKQALEFKAFAESMNDMFIINHENEALAELLFQFENRKVEFEEAIVCRDERIMFENKVGRLYLNGIQGIVLAIEDACHDEELVYLVEELCLQCNIPGNGSGLDETEQDVSERMLY